jgi:hypothetical protein
MPRSQEFGFHMENLVRVMIHKLQPKLNDTKIHDIPMEDNKFNKETESIKTTKMNSIDCSDVLRFYSYDMKDPHVMVVFRYKQIGLKRKIHETLVLRYNSECKKVLFGNITDTEIKALDSYVKSIPHFGCTSEHRKTYKKMAEDMKEKSGGWISYAPKVDSKTQRRVQCSIRKLDDFLKKYPQFIISRTPDCSLHGITLETEHDFGPRIRNQQTPESDSEPDSPPS